MTFMSDGSLQSPLASTGGDQNAVLCGQQGRRRFAEFSSQAANRWGKRECWPAIVGRCDHWPCIDAHPNHSSAGSIVENSASALVPSRRDASAGIKPWASFDSR